MPDIVYTPRDRGDGRTEINAYDQINLANAKNAQDWMIQQAMMKQDAQRLQAQLADNAANRNNQLAIQGAFRDRAANAQALEGLRGQNQLANTQQLGQNELGVAGLQTAAQRAASAREDDQWQLERPLIEQRNSLRTYAGNMLQNELGMSQSRDPQDAMVAQGIANMRSPTSAANYTSVPDATPSPYPYKPSTGVSISPSANSGTSGLGSLNSMDRFSVLGALASGGQMPDLAQRDYQRQTQALQLDETKQRIAQNRAAAYRQADQPEMAEKIERDAGIAPQISGSKPEDIATVIEQQLPNYVNQDTDSWWSRGLKGAGAGALAVGVPAAAGGAMVTGPLAGLGGLFTGAVGGAIGGVGGFLSGALSGKGDPSQDQQDQLVALYLQLVKAYTARTGNPVTAKQLALAKFQEIAQHSSQGSDYLTDADADQTRALFDRLK